MKLLILMSIIFLVFPSKAEMNMSRPFIKGRVWMCAGNYYIKPPFYYSSMVDGNVITRDRSDIKPKEHIETLLNAPENLPIQEKGIVKKSNFDLVGYGNVEYKIITIKWDDYIPIRRYWAVLKPQTPITRGALVSALLALSEEQIIERNLFQYKTVSVEVSAVEKIVESEFKNPNIKFVYKSTLDGRYLTQPGNGGFFEGIANNKDSWTSIGVTEASSKVSDYFCDSDKILKRSIFITSKEITNELGEKYVRELLTMEFSDRFMIKYSGN